MGLHPHAPQVFQALGQPSPADKRSIAAPPEFADALELPEKQRKLGVNALSWLHTYLSGKGLPCAVEVKPGRGDSVMIGVCK